LGNTLHKPALFILVVALDLRCSVFVFVAVDGK